MIMDDDKKNCINVADSRNVGKYLYKIRCKLENQISSI